MMNRNDIPLTTSWQRSKKYGVDPVNVENDLLTSGELKDRKEQLQLLFQSCSKVLDQLYFQLKDSLFMVLVADADGYIVFSRGDAPFTDYAKNISLNSGANWSEKVKGTNAIGTAITEERHISVIGKQHFSQENQFLTCYSCPLYSPTGKLLGILDVSGDVKQHHPHTLGMVVAAAQACQSQLLLHYKEKELTLSFKETDTVINNSSQPLISVNHHGIIQHMNQKAARFLKQPVKQCIGQPLANWFDRPTIDNLLMTKNPVAQVKKDSSTWTAEIIRDNRQKMYRSILTLTPEKTNAKTVPSTEKKSIIWECPKVNKVRQFAHNIAQTNATVLIQGETGTGKDVIAQEIHQASGREGDLITLNCGAIPEQLIESELFGYEKGAFTGASQKGNIGKFKAADKGTLFLDEIGEMPLQLQTALLQVLDQKRITPVGAHRSQYVDVRILAATNRDLLHEIKEGRFRSDLYYRLCELKITLPPLRERTDFSLLVKCFLEKVSQELCVGYFTMDDSILERMSGYNWPGNIRELQHVIRQAAYQAYFSRGSKEITEADVYLPAQQDFSEGGSENNEEDVIAQAIRETKGNLSLTARLLGIGRTTLYRKLKYYPHLKEVRKGIKELKL